MNDRYPPVAINPTKVGAYPALSKSGGGYFYDEVLEYRVWVHPEDGYDFCHVFARYEDAEQFSAATRGAEKPLALVLQREWVNEPEPNRFEVKRGERLTEWRIEWLKDSKRHPGSIEGFIRQRQRQES